MKSTKMVEEILNGKRITIPTSQQIAVVKSAQLNKQIRDRQNCLNKL